MLKMRGVTLLPGFSFKLRRKKIGTAQKWRGLVAIIWSQSFWSLARFFACFGHGLQFLSWSIVPDYTYTVQTAGLTKCPLCGEPILISNFDDLTLFILTICFQSCKILSKLSDSQTVKPHSLSFSHNILESNLSNAANKSKRSAPTHFLSLISSIQSVVSGIQWQLLQQIQYDIFI